MTTVDYRVQHNTIGMILVKIQGGPAGASTSLRGVSLLSNTVRHGQKHRETFALLTLF